MAKGRSKHSGTAAPVFTNNEQFHFSQLPGQFSGLQYTVCPAGKEVPSTVQVPADCTVYVLVEVDQKDDGFDEVVTWNNRNWNRSGTARLGDRIKVAIFQQYVRDATTLDLTVQGIYFIAAQKKLEAIAEKQPKPLHKKKPQGGEEDATGPESAAKSITRRRLIHPLLAKFQSSHHSPTLQQTSIKSLEIIKTDSDMMLGTTSEMTLTLSPGRSSRRTSVRYVNPVGPEMRLARDDAQRYVQLKYPHRVRRHGRAHLRRQIQSPPRRSNGRPSPP